MKNIWKRKIFELAAKNKYVGTLTSNESCAKVYHLNQRMMKIFFLGNLTNIRDFSFQTPQFFSKKMFS